MSTRLIVDCRFADCRLAEGVARVCNTGIEFDKSAIRNWKSGDVINQQSAINQKCSFTRYSKFKGFDVSSINLGDVDGFLSDALLDSGYDDDYYWTRQQKQTDTSLDASTALPCFRRWLRRV